MQELYAPLMTDDFEIGDRVYHVNGLKDSAAGRVKEIHNSWLHVQMDNGEWRQARIRLFDRKDKHWSWHRVLDLKTVAPGMEISRLGRRGRVFATVLEVIPHRSIVLGQGKDTGKRQLTNSTPIRYQASPGWPIEVYLQGWGIEG